MISSYIRNLAETEVQRFFANHHYSLCIENIDPIIDSLSKRLESAAAQCIDAVFLHRLIDEGLIESYLNQENLTGDNPELLRIRDVKESFAMDLKNNDEEIIWKKNNQLSERVRILKSFFFDAMDELLCRFLNDLSSIETNLLNGKKINRIVEIDPGLGDPHNNGRSTCLIITDAGKLVYKPHSLNIDAWIGDFFDRFFPNIIKLPKTIVCNNYGYSEFIMNSPADTLEKAKEYYYHMGVFAVCFHILGGTDMHFENMLAQGSCPTPVDLETIINPGYSVNVATEEEKAAGVYESVSSLFPIRVGNKEISILYADSSENCSAPVVDGKRLLLSDCLEDFLNGYRTAYKRTLEIKNELIDHLQEIPVFSVRIILRSTQAYYSLYAKTCSYAWSKDEQLKEKMFEALKVTCEKGDEIANPKILRSETNAIYNADIPYFHALTNSKTIRGYEGAFCDDFLSKTCIQNSVENVKQMNEASMNYGITLFRRSLEKLYENLDEKRKPEIQITDYHHNSREEYIHRAERIFDRLLEDSVTQPNGTVRWITVDSLTKTSLYFGDNGYMNGLSGTALFSAALSTLSTDQRIRECSTELTHKLLRQISDDLAIYKSRETKKRNPCSLSFSNGVAGIALTNELISEYITTPETEEIRSNAIEILLKSDTTYVGNDVISGISGIMLVICSFNKLCTDPQMMVLVERLGETLLSGKTLKFNNSFLCETINGKPLLSGLGHGQAGVALAMERAGKCLGRKDFLVASEEAFEFEYQNYSENAKAWPDLRNSTASNQFMYGYCAGAPGIGLSLLGRNDEKARFYLEKAIESCLNQDILYRDHLCCGNCSSIDFLLEAGRSLKRAELTEKARERMDIISARADREGDYVYFQPDMKNHFISSLFFGAEGTGYTLLRCADSGKIKNVFGL